ncbi:MAG: hypothetical protein LHW59_05480 [Candidatus Cloacimonetes bacterium]|nr:hypothetical protein [Candidatus Cloacimonadota bacterium]
MSTTQKVHKISLIVDAQTKQLRSVSNDFKSLERDIARVTGKVDVLATTFKASQSKMQQSIRATANASKESTTSSINGFVRHIRQVESFVVALYALKTAYDLTLGRGFEFNKMVENETIGFKLLIAQNMAAVDSKGNLLTATQKFTLAQGEANKALKIAREINIETPQTLGETIQIMKLLTPQVLKYGGTLKDTGEITKNIAISSKAMGVEFQELLKTVDSVMTGESKESGLQRAMGQFGITNELIKKTVAEGGSVVELFKDKLKGAAVAGVELADSWDGISSNFINEWDSMLAEAEKPIFEYWKRSLKDITNFFIINGKEIVSDLMTISSAVWEVGKAFVLWKGAGVVVGIMRSAITALEINMRALNIATIRSAGAMTTLELATSKATTATLMFGRSLWQLTKANAWLIGIVALYEAWNYASSKLATSQEQINKGLAIEVETAKQLAPIEREKMALDLQKAVFQQGILVVGLKNELSLGKSKRDLSKEEIIVLEARIAQEQRTQDTLQNNLNILGDIKNGTYASAQAAYTLGDAFDSAKMGAIGIVSELDQLNVSLEKNIIQAQVLAGKISEAQGVKLTLAQDTGLFQKQLVEIGTAKQKAYDQLQQNRDKKTGKYDEATLAQYKAFNESMDIQLKKAVDAQQKTILSATQREQSIAKKASSASTRAGGRATSIANKDYRNQAKDIINEEKYGIKIAQEKLNLLEEQHKQELLLAEIKAGGALSDREQRKFDIDYLTKKLAMQEESIDIAKKAWEEAKASEIKQANELGTPKTEEQRRIKENTLQKLHANVLATEVDYQKQITEQKEIQKDLAIAELSDMDKMLNIMKNGVSDLSSSFAEGGVQGFADGMKSMMGSMIDTMKQSGDMITMLIGYAIDIVRGLFNTQATQEEIDKAKGKSDFSDDSIRNLGDMFANVQYPMLEVTNKMYKNIRNMDNNFQSVARAITGKASASGVDLTGANFVQTNEVGFLGFSSESVSLIGTGLQFQLQKLTDMMDIASLSVKGYTSKLVESSSFWGLFSDSDVETTFQNLPASVKKDIAGIFASGYESILMAGITLGFSDENIKNALATAKLNLAKIDFTGLSPAEVNDRFSQAVSEAFSGVINGIDMFTGLIDRYATANEYALETLTRIATEYDQVNYSLSLIGKNLTDAVGGFTKQMQVLDIVASTGGLQNFNDAMGSFMANFYDSTEQFQFLEKSMAQAFATLGLVAPKSNVEFRNLLEGMDTTTEQGAYLYGQVLLLADGFNQMTTAGKNLGSTLQDALKKISDAYLGEYSPYTMLQKTQYATEVARVARENGTSMDSVDAAYQALVTSAKSATKQEDTIRQFNAYIAALENEIPDATNRDIVNELEEIRKAIENQTDRIRFTA